MKWVENNCLNWCSALPAHETRNFLVNLRWTSAHVHWFVDVELESYTHWRTRALQQPMPYTLERKMHTPIQSSSSKSRPMAMSIPFQEFRQLLQTQIFLFLVAAPMRLLFLKIQEMKFPIYFQKKILRE